MRHIRLIFIATLVVWATATPAWAQTAEVEILGSEYIPAEIEVSPGTTVTWVNEDAFDHTVTADDGSFDERVEGGESTSIIFEEGGEFPYFCEIHPEMTGTVTVQREPTDPGGNGDGNGDDDVGDETTDELPNTGPADLWAFVYVGMVFVGAGATCLRVSRI